MDKIRIPDGWTIDGYIVHRLSDRVRVVGDAGEHVHKLAEVTDALTQERRRMPAERFAGEG
jgi:hypothetical protein